MQIYLGLKTCFQKKISPAIKQMQNAFIRKDASSLQKKKKNLTQILKYFHYLKATQQKQRAVLKQHLDHLSLASEKKILK